MQCPRKHSHYFVIAFSVLLSACGGGGGGSSTPTPANGSAATTEVDSDHDGLIEISSLEQLDWIRNNPDGTSLIDFAKQSNSKGCPAGGCFGYELVADLNFDTNGDGVINNSDTYFDYGKNGTNAGWLPISQLTGTFEGNGHHIRNLFINRPTEFYVGLFASIAVKENAIVKIQNLYLDGPLLSVTGKLDIGALAGNISNSGQLTIAHITQSGHVFSTGGAFVGGMAGYISTRGTLVIDANSATSSVESTQHIAGGLIGILLADGAPQLTITDNTSSSNVTGASAGGLIASLSTGMTPTVLAGNSSAGTVTSTSYAGGLIASISGEHMELRDSHSSASVSAPVAAGGFAGSLKVSPTIKNIYATGSVTSTGYAGGLIGDFDCADGFYLEESYATGNVMGLYTVTTSVGSQSVTGSVAGGLIGRAHIPSTGTCGARYSYAAGAVIGGIASGGIVGYLSSDNANGTLMLSDNFYTGAVSAFNDAGGLIGYVTLSNSASFTATRNLALGQITHDATSFIGVSGGLAGVIISFSPATANFTFNYWASDTTTASASIGATSPSIVQTGNVLATRTELECPISANNLSCASGELFHNWSTSLNSQGQPVWDFGNTAQLPGLRIGNSVHRPTYNGTSYSITIENI